MRKIRQCFALVGMLVCGACNGFPDAAPWVEAERKPEHYPTYAPVSAPMLSTEGQRWVILQGATMQPFAGQLQPIAAGAGGELSAARWDSAPYDALYARSPDGRTLVAAEVR